MTEAADVASIRDAGPMRRYAEAEQAHGRVIERVGGQMRTVEVARLTTFIVAAVVGLLYNDLPVSTAVTLSVSGLAATAFVFLVIRHSRLRRTFRRAEIGAALAKAGQLRIWRQWDRLEEVYESVDYADPLLAATSADQPAHPYAADLDLLGEGSVRALLGPTPTPMGVVTLREWLLDGAPPDEIRRRQGAVEALAPAFDEREALATEGLLVEGSTERALADFVAWLDHDRLFGAALPGWAVHVARLLPPVTLLFAVLDAVGSPVPTWTWAVPLAVQGTLIWSWARRLNGYFGLASTSSRGLRRLHRLFERWEAHETDDPYVRELQGRLRSSEAVASAEIRTLERWLDAADSRLSSLHFLLAWFLLWDVHVAWGLEGWRARSGARVPDWLDAMGTLEALSSLATLAHDQPLWCRPTVAEGEGGFMAQELGHPLLADSVRKTSDVQVDPPGRFVLVTGSNMSGKSTLLRSIGLAAVLAQAGSVVCARDARMSRLRPFTSMRIQDSLTEGVSLFMAELNRLKALVDAAGQEGPPLLYLIDEVLQGTNSEERRVAARRIVRHLLETPAIGAVTTHDLSLHEEPTLDAAATKVHFREHVGGDGEAAILTFDYRLRPGLATTRNALKLLEIVGLDADDRG